MLLGFLTSCVFTSWLYTNLRGPCSWLLAHSRGREHIPPGMDPSTKSCMRRGQHCELHSEQRCSAVLLLVNRGPDGGAWLTQIHECRFHGSQSHLPWKPDPRKQLKLGFRFKQRWMLSHLWQWEMRSDVDAGHKADSISDQEAWCSSC
jgi:hypothetical protein